MTFERFKEIDIRVLEAIGLTLDKVRLKSFSDFVLLLASGDYYEVLYTHTNDMSPYVIEDPTDELIDDTRQSFLNSFLRKFINRLKKGDEMDDQELEYEINIQLMVYTHVWESHWFLKQLERIAAILSGKGMYGKVPCRPHVRVLSSKNILSKGWMKSRTCWILSKDAILTH